MTVPDKTLYVTVAGPESFFLVKSSSPTTMISTGSPLFHQSPTNIITNSDLPSQDEPLSAELPSQTQRVPQHKFEIPYLSHHVQEVGRVADSLLLTEAPPNFLPPGDGPRISDVWF